MPPEWIMFVENWNWPDDIGTRIVRTVFCVCCGCAITPPYKCCLTKKYYPYSSVRLGISLIEWLTLIIVGIMIDDDVVQDKTSYLFKTEHCLFFFIAFLMCFVIFTFYPYLMPDLRLPLNIPIRSMHGYAFLGELTELERLKDSNVDNFWDKRFDDLGFLAAHFGVYLASRFSSVGYHSGVLLSMQLNDEEVGLMCDKMKGFDPRIDRQMNKQDRVKKYHDLLKEYHDNVKKLTKRKFNCKLASILALSNKQYETLEWLEKNGAKHHIWLFKNIANTATFQKKKEI